MFRDIVRELRINFILVKDYFKYFGGGMGRVVVWVGKEVRDFGVVFGLVGLEVCWDVGWWGLEVISYLVRLRLILGVVLFRRFSGSVLREVAVLGWTRRRCILVMF